MLLRILLLVKDMDDAAARESVMGKKLHKKCKKLKDCEG